MSVPARLAYGREPPGFLSFAWYRMKEITLAHSPDADDVAMWWPLVGLSDLRGTPLGGESGDPAFDTCGWRFRTIAQDIQVLNARAIEQGDLDITAISAHAYPYLAARYQITKCGASMGESYGPKLVVRADSPDTSLEQLLERIDTRAIAIPGRHTTAFLTLSILAGRSFATREMHFQSIIGSVLEGQVSAGLLIHEAQLDPESLGLRTILELGPAWTRLTGTPLPLGLNVLRRDLDERFGAGSCAEVAGLLQRSVRHAIQHPAQTRAFLLARSEARPEWQDAALLDRYLGMYVNDRTVDMGQDGVDALRRLYAEGSARGLCADPGTIDAI